MNSILVTGLKHAKNAIANGAGAVINSYLWAGRNVEQLAHDKLPETAAKVVSAAFWTLPYTALAVFVPTFVFMVGAALSLGIWGGLGREIDEGMGKDHRQHLFAGIRNASVIHTAAIATTIAATGVSAWLLATAVQCLFIGVQAHGIVKQDTPPPAADTAPTAA